MRSNGGEMTLDEAVETPIQIAVSGPTGGVIAAKRTGEVLGLPNLVTLDMGGTSTDVSTVVNGKEKFTTDFEIEWGRPIQIPMIDIRTIGAGGGSIARIDSGRYAGGRPRERRRQSGTRVLRNGGEKPTVTDANVVLGRISAQNFLGGTMNLDAEAARKAIATIADVLGISVEAGGPRDRAHRQQQHGGRAPYGSDRTGPRPAGFRAGSVRRRGSPPHLRSHDRSFDPERPRAELPRPVLGVRVHDGQCAG